MAPIQMSAEWWMDYNEKGVPYYHNTVTKVTQYPKPAEFDKPPAAVPAPSNLQHQMEQEALLAYLGNVDKADMKPRVEEIAVVAPASSKPVAKAGYMTGTAKKWVDEKAFGFVSPDDGKEDAFVHKMALPAGEERLETGARVQFQMVFDERKGKSSAKNVGPIGYDGQSNEEAESGGGKSDWGKSDDSGGSWKDKDRSAPYDGGGGGWKDKDSGGGGWKDKEPSWKEKFDSAPAGTWVDFNATAAAPAPAPKPGEWVDFGAKAAEPTKGEWVDFGAKSAEPKKAEWVDFGAKAAEPPKKGEWVDFGASGADTKAAGWVDFGSSDTSGWKEKKAW